MNSLPQSHTRLTATQWLIVSMAAIGFCFDIYELLMMQFVVGDLIQELTGYKPGEDGFIWWGSMIFYLPAFAGGIFGLLGGYLTDRLGRRRVLTWSILIYALRRSRPGSRPRSACCSCCACTTFVGVCVEFVAAVAWLAELFPEPRRRENILGYTQAFSSLGGFMVAGAYWLASHYGSEWPAVALPEWLGFLGEIKNGNCAVALYAHVGRDSRAAVDLHPAIFARVAELGAKAGGRHAAAAEHLRAVFAEPAADDDCQHHRVRMCLRSGVWSDPTVSPDRARRAGGEGSDRG